MLIRTLCLTIGILGTAGQPPEHCPDGSIRHGNSCYFIGHLLANWPDSLVYCKSRMAHLARIETAWEQHYIAGMLRTFMGVSTDPSKYFWLGGTDAVSEGQWIWARSAEPVELSWSPMPKQVFYLYANEDPFFNYTLTYIRDIHYTNWKPGEPNNDPNHADHHQDCMAIYGQTGLWDDGWCETKHNFICEVELYDGSVDIIG